MLRTRATLSSTSRTLSSPSEAGARFLEVATSPMSVQFDDGENCDPTQSMVSWQLAAW